MRLPRQILCLLVIAALPATISGLVHPQRPSWRSDEVTLESVRSWGDKVLWIDARERSAYDKDHIPGALLLNEDDWNSLLPEVVSAWSDDQHVVVYCSSLSCHTSKEVAKRLREELGLPEVSVLKGGWETWKAAK